MFLDTLVSCNGGNFFSRRRQAKDASAIDASFRFDVVLKGAVHSCRKTGNVLRLKHKLGKKTESRKMRHNRNLNQYPSLVMPQSRKCCSDMWLRTQLTLVSYNTKQALFNLISHLSRSFFLSIYLYSTLRIKDHILIHTTYIQCVNRLDSMLYLHF